MRVLLLIIICALTLGGYAAAGHASDDPQCASVTVDGQTDGCGHAKADDGADKSSGHEKTGAANCMGCNHCCASSYAIGSSSVIIGKTDATYSAYPSAPPRVGAQDRVVSLIRPPKNLA